MKKYKYLLFDLDGTLTDSGAGIINSIIYALSKFGISVPAHSQLYKFIGPPILESFSKYYGFDDVSCWEALRYFREYFAEKGIFENEVYPGVAEMLGELKSAGHSIILATSKPEESAVRVLEHFSLVQYFDFIAGSTMDETRSSKDAVIAYALSGAGITEKGSAIMVGDREHDVIGAKQNSLPCVGVLYGYGSRQELIDAGAEHIVETVGALKTLLI